MNLEVVGVLNRLAKLIRRHDELLAGQPSSGVDHDVANSAGRVIENDIIDLAELLVIEPVDLGASDVVRGFVGVSETIIA
jgi:hypothetical protein